MNISKYYKKKKCPRKEASKEGRKREETERKTEEHKANTTNISCLFVIQRRKDSP